MGPGLDQTHISLGSRASNMPEKFRPDLKIDFQSTSTFYTTCINILIDKTGPLIILWSIIVLIKQLR